MGGDSSKNSTFQEAWSRFNQDEQSNVKAMFSTTSGEQICEEKLKVHLQPYFSEKLIEAVYLTLQEMSSIQNGFTVDGLVMFLSMMLKGSLTNKALALTRLVWFSHQDINILTKQYFIEFVCVLVESFLTIAKSCSRAQSWPLASSADTCHRFAIYLTQDLTTDGYINPLIFKPAKTDLCCSLEECPFADRGEVVEDAVERWLSGTPIFLHMNDLIWHTCFRLHFSEESAHYFLTPKIPRLKQADQSTVNTILDIPALLLLSHNLSAEYNVEWRLLFSNKLHGDSFSQLLTRIVKKGPNLLLIRDTEGYVFGGFATESWDIRPQFVGSAHCFLFSLYPEMGVYTPSGYNENYMYLNKAVQTMPNGLGMGGQLNYFGLWIDQSFSEGHSKAQPRCTTYNSPQLSAHPEFEVDTLEVWAVAPEKKDDPDETEHRSILDKDPEAKALLSMINRGPVSEGLREGDELATTPQEHVLPPL